ncbi:MAG TPA: DNA primase, partial [Pengzhenrongella sp.]
SGLGDSRRPGQGAPTSSPKDRMPLPDVRDPVARTERTALEVVLQLPALVPAEFDDLGDDAFSAPAYRAVHEAIRAAGGLQGAREELAAAGDRGSAAWVARVQEEAASPVAGLVTELAVAPLPEDRAEVLPDYVRGVVLAILEIGFTRRIADLRGRLQRMDGVADPGGYQALFTELIALENRRRTLRDSA